MSIQLLGCNSMVRHQWNRYVERGNCSLYHRIEWFTAAANCLGHDAYPLVSLSHGETIDGILPLVRLKSVLFGDFMVSLPWFNYGGPAADDPYTREALVEQACELARELGVSHLELRCTERLEAQLDCRLEKIALILPLAQDHEAQWARLPSKLRSQIRRPSKDGFVATSGGAELLPEFYRTFAVNMRDLGTPVYPLDFFKMVIDCAGKAADIVLVKRSQEVAAAALLLTHGGRTEIPWASSLRTFNRFGVNMLLYWEAIRAALARGSTEFDLGRSSVDSGTHRFKLQWGAQPRQLYWHYWTRDGAPRPELNPANPKYRLAVATWKRLPISVANWLGPRIVRNLP